MNNTIAATGTPNTTLPIPSSKPDPVFCIRPLTRLTTTALERIDQTVRVDQRYSSHPEFLAGAALRELSA